MTANLPHQPNRPPQPGGYNPITFDDLQKPASPATQDMFASLLNPVPRWAAAPFFGFLCFYTQKLPVIAPLLVLILLSCLLARMEEQPRKIAAVPLTLSAIKLSLQMANQTAYAFWISGATHGNDDGCFYWLPLFFSACLVFIPKRESVTFKIVVVCSCILLASGLLPSVGFIGIFYLLDYTLFLVMLVGLVIDVAAYWPARADRNLAAAH